MGKRVSPEFKAAMGKRLLTARTAAGKSKEAVGGWVGVTRQAVAQWEAGDTLPSLEAIRILADYYGTTADWLLGRSAEQFGDLMSGLDNEGQERMREYATYMRERHRKYDPRDGSDSL